MAFICFTLLVLANSSNSRYLLVELDGSPDMGPGMDSTTEENGMPEPEGEPIDDMEPEPLPEDDEEDVMPEEEEKPTRRPRALHQNAPGGGYRSKPAPKNKKGIAAKPGANGKGKQKPKPPITNPAECNEGKKCITNAGKKDPSQGAAGRWWTTCQGYPVCMHPFYSSCYYTWGPHTYCMYG